MLNINREMNETAVTLARNAIDVMRLRAKNGEYIWVSELKKSTWRSTCAQRVTSHLYESNRIFECDIKTNQLCFTYMDGSV